MGKVTSEQVKENERIVRAWADECDYDEQYTRSVLLSMLHVARNPNHRDHTGPMTADLCIRWAALERAAVNDYAPCAKCADTLENLAGKLY